MDISSRTLYIENFPLDTSETTIKRLFAKFGKVRLVNLPSFPPEHPLNKGLPKHKSKGYAFVEFTTIAEAQKALAFFNDLNYILLPNQEEKTVSIIDIDDSQKMTDISRDIILDSEFRRLLLLRVMKKQDFLEFSRSYEEQRFQSLVRVAKMLMVSESTKNID